MLVDGRAQQEMVVWSHLTQNLDRFVQLVPETLRPCSCSVHVVLQWFHKLCKILAALWRFCMFVDHEIVFLLICMFLFIFKVVVFCNQLMFTHFIQAEQITPEDMIQLQTIFIPRMKQGRLLLLNRVQTMVAGAFPIVKLGYLAVKQVSKPIANLIKRNAKNSPFFKKYVCMPPAQLYHWLEVNFRLRLMGLGKAQSVEKLNDEMAIELGAEMLGEFIIFTIAAGTLLLEYQRSSKKEELKEEREKHQLLVLKQKLQDLDLITAVQEAQIRELQRAVDELESQNQSMVKRLFGGGKTNK